jgi:beta-glucanase (GH16 family)
MKYKLYRKNLLLILFSAVSFTLLLSQCGRVSFVQQPDLYRTAEEMIEADNTSTEDNGYKPSVERQGWSLVWTDEFGGPEIDTTKWEHEVNGNGGGNNELQYYTASKANSYIKDGFLVIKGIKQNYKGKFYTSARLRTAKKADWTYGRFDIRAKLPVQQGIWPAIWMLPTDWVYGSWPQSGEIDIMEIIGSKPGTLYGTVHYGDPWPNNKWKSGILELPSGEDFSQKFHVFSVEWEPNEIRWYMDDSLYATRVPADLFPHRWPFDQKFHMILNLAIGGNWPGPPDESTTFPKYMWVDYVRVYKKNEF